MATDAGVTGPGGGSSLAVLVRTWRERALLTQEQLARRTGLSSRTIRRMESNDLGRPRSESVRLLADALELTSAERARLVAAAQAKVHDEVHDEVQHGQRPVRPPVVAGPARQLPAGVTGFAGRTEQLAQLDALLDGEGATPNAVVVSAIGGTAGVGKTALAVHWAHRVAGRFPDGQLYVNLRGFDPGATPAEPAAAIRGFLDALGVSPQQIPADLDAQAALYRSLLAGRRMLIMLDNARDAEQVRPLLPGTPGCLAVVTSRNHLAGLVATEGAYPLVLDVLSVAEARELLVRRLGHGRVTAEPRAIDEIIIRCARLPLALAIAAARAVTHPHVQLHTLVAELADSRNRLDALTGGDPASDVRTVFSWSYRTLTPPAARLFRLLGLHPGPDIADAAVASLAGLPLSQVRPMLAELTHAHLLVEHGPGRYTLHDLLRTYAAELAHTVDPDRQRHAATRRILDHYLHTAHAADRLLDPARDPITVVRPSPDVTPEHLADHGQAIDWFIAEHFVLLAAVDHTAAIGWDTYTWQLAWALSSYLHWRGHWHELAATWHAAVAAAQRLADSSGQAYAHRFLARAHTRLGRFDDARTHLRHALDLFQQAGDEVGQAHTHRMLGFIWDQQGRPAEALDHAWRSLGLYQTASHRCGQAIALSTIGWLYAQLGDHRQALTSCQQALDLLQELGDQHGQASTWDSLGYAHHHLGHHGQAITCYRHAINLFRALGDRYQQADTLIHLGDAHLAVSDPDAARDAWQHALTILDELDHPDADQVRTKLATMDARTDALLG